MSEADVTESIEEELSPKELYTSFANHMDALLLENQKAYDQAILALSSTSITGLLAFTQAKQILILPCAFYGTVGLYWASIVVTLFSFLCAQTVVSQKRMNAYKYYIEKEESYFNKKILLDDFVRALHWVTGGFFVVATFLAISFISTATKEAAMVKDNQSNQIREGFTGPNFTKIPDGKSDVSKGMTGPKMAPIPVQSTLQPAPANHGVKNGK